MKMRPLALGALVALLASAPGRAADAPDDDSEELSGETHDGGRFLEILDRRLKLKPEQKAKVKAVVDETQPQMKKAREELKELQERLQKLMRTQHEKIRGLLDDEQKWKYDEIAVRMRQRMQERQGRRRRMPGPPPEDEDEEVGRPSRRRMPGRDMPPPEMWHEGEPGKGKPSPDPR
ncbi:MAG: hypothetical protein HY554_01015 [Elusimicrobia bacterium]|nr:hypothetical protein [Elusimicrobiota bacterium]